MQAGNAKYLLSGSIGDCAIVKEIWEQNVYRYHPRPNDVVMDIGGHKGVFSVWAALHGAFVYAFEPCRESYENLLLNAEMNDVADRICARNMGIWSQACRLPLYYWPGDAGGNSLVENTRRDSEDALCISLALAFNDIRWCDFMKFDTEGSEFEVFQYVPDSILERIGALSIEIHSPALDPGGRANPQKFTAYSDERYALIVARLSKHFHIEELRAGNGDPNYLYCTRGQDAGL